MTPLSPPPVPTPFAGTTMPSRGWIQWFQEITAKLQGYFGTVIGIGNGATATVQAPAKGSGNGPADPLAVAAFVQVQIGTETYWSPLFK